MSHGSLLCLSVAAAALAVGAPLSSAVAATVTSTFTVTANGTTNCTPTANLRFGAYSGTVVTGTTTRASACPTGAPYTLGLNAGAAAGAAQARPSLTRRALTRTPSR